jgi:SAM-dependent methyltransferase
MSDYAGISNLEVMEEAVRYNDFLFGLIHSLLRPGDRVLDFGAGTGTFARRLQAAGAAPSCVEPDEQLRARLQAAGLAAFPDTATVGSASFDVVYSLNVLEHIADDGAALADLRRVLRPGGRLLIYVPAFMLLYSSMDQRIGHLRRYRRGPLRQLALRSGLGVENIRYADSLGFLAALGFRLLGRRDGQLALGAVRFYDRWLFPVSRALDLAVAGVIGKNLVLHAYRPQSR